MGGSFGVEKGPKMGAKMEPKSNPRRTKIDDKIEVETSSSRSSSWSRLGSILGRLGCDLGVIFVLSFERRSFFFEAAEPRGRRPLRRGVPLRPHVDPRDVPRREPLAAVPYQELVVLGHVLHDDELAPDVPLLVRRAVKLVRASHVHLLVRAGARHELHLRASLVRRRGPSLFPRKNVQENNE